MNKFVKSLFRWSSGFSLSLLLLLSSGPAQAQWASGYQVTTIVNGGTNNIAAGGTNLYTHLTMVANRSENMVVGVKYNFHVAPVGVTPTLTLRIQRSADGSNWENQFGSTSAIGTTGFHAFTANGATNACVAITNLTVAGMPYLRVASVENTNSAVVTNLTIFYGVKR